MFRAMAHDGIRIVDFSTHLSGPLATHLLAELGATVIKIENPRYGDGNRGIFEVAPGAALFHLSLNSGTRSLAVDRHSDEWPDVVAACARWADAVVVGARPLDARRRGMDFDTMRAANPELIYCSVSGFGDEGPWRDLTAHGQTIDSYAGLVDVVDGDPQPHTRPGWRTAGTTLGGVFAAIGLLAAINRRDRARLNREPARPQYLSVSLWQAAMWWSWRDLTTLANAGEPWLDYSDLGSRYSLYRTKDRRVVLVAPSERRFWEPFIDLAGLPAKWKQVGEWGASGMDHGAGDAYAHERIAIAERMATRTLDEWMPLFAEAEIPFAPVLTLDEAVSSQHAEVNGVMRKTELEGTTYKIPAVPVRFGADDASLERPEPMSEPPAIGADTAELLAELGVAQAEDATAAR
jgi:crotonobetainyl-CoA:carnitine CoA-transferase CaiB-like acyl-CoA transferase